MELDSSTSPILDTSLERVDLSTRTSNCCAAAGILTLGQMSQLSSIQIMGWRNAGRKTVREIREVLGSVGLKLADDGRPIGKPNEQVLLKLTSPILETAPRLPLAIYLETALPVTRKSLVFPLNKLPLSVRAQNIAVRLEARYLGEIAQLSADEILAVSNAGKRTLQEFNELLAEYGLEFGTPIPDWSRDRAIQIEKELRDAISESAKERTKILLAAVDGEPTCLEAELRRVVRAVEKDRNAEALLKLWGWNGNGPRVLDSVGQEYRLTRERVRQIEARTLNRIATHQFDLHFLRRALRLLKDNVPALDSALSRQLFDAGISRAPFSIWGLKVAAEIFKLRWPFDAISVKSTRMLVNSGDEPKFRRSLQVLRRRTSDRGLTSVLSLASEVGLEDHRISALKTFIELAVSVSWLDDPREWVFLPGLSRNRLFNLCSKVLAVSPTMRVAELRRAVGKSPRLAIVPPQRILGAFIEKVGLGTVSSDGVIVANAGIQNAPTSDSVEGLMMSVLAQYGPVMDGETFARRSVDAGVNPISFYIYRANSPLISALGKGVYAKVGAEVAPGTVEDIVSRRSIAPRISEHGWTPAGRLWFGFELSLQTMTAGGIRIVSFVADLVQGEWNVYLPDDTGCGSVTCRESFIWSFRKAFALLGAEAGDLAAFEFDLQSRTVHVRVGGPGLFEQIEEPPTLAEEDEPTDDEKLMSNDDAQIRFEASADLRKWPSINQQRVVADGGRPYLVAEGTLDSCIQQFMAKPINQHHLYEIHTEPQGELVSAILSAKHIIEIARLRDLL
jgi:Bacterial RNA polymerase, alpha chain C terminal domain